MVSHFIFHLSTPSKVIFHIFYKTIFIKIHSVDTSFKVIALSGGSMGAGGKR